MGLEAINFFFRSEEQIQHAITLNKDIVNSEGKKYVYKKDNDYWIDIEIQDLYSLSIRVTLCNPMDSVLSALDRLLSFLFSSKGSMLTDISAKKVYNIYNEDVKEALKESYLKRKKMFEEIYGDYTAAIGSEDFYRRQMGGISG
ncbi:MAG: hypothetical protein J0H92_00860 [Sphingobacteriales bacterium]|nr:hypothetical protein [Sphingobacteriales bacterium]OJW35407.1 MAG: hypothetical protein BGO54_02245 [Sphingobacteriales bacterium 46-32]